MNVGHVTEVLSGYIGKSGNDIDLVIILFPGSCIDPEVRSAERKVGKLLGIEVEYDIRDVSK